LLQRLADGTLLDDITGEILREESTYLYPNEVMKVVNLEKAARSKGVNRHVAKKILDPTLERWCKGYQYTKVFSDTMNVVGKELSGAECKIIMLLLSYIRYDSGMIATLKGNPLTNQDIVEIVKMSKRTVSDIMDGLVKKRIFARNRVGVCNQYFANPYIFLRGNYINKTLKAMFKNYHNPKMKKLGIKTEGKTQ